MINNENAKCRLCREGLCMPIQTSTLAEAMGVENFKCDKCGTVFAVRFRPADDYKPEPREETGASRWAGDPAE